jgi:hypothetical protein
LKRQRVLLAVLGVLVLLAAWRYLAPGDDEPIVPPAATARVGDPEDGGARPGPPAAPRAGANGASQAPVREVLDLRLSALQRDPQSYTPRRDPWRFVDPPPPPPPPEHKPTAAELAAERAAAELAARQRAEAEERARLEALIPKPPPFTLKYLGNFGTAERRLAVFTDGKTIYNVREGGTIDGKFTVNHIGFESVDIGFVGFPDAAPQRLPAGR